MSRLIDKKILVYLGWITYLCGNIVTITILLNLKSKKMVKIIKGNLLKAFKKKEVNVLVHGLHII
jgi:hypothetical protein